MTEATWHYQDGDKPAGPVSAAVIRQKIQAGQIRRGSLLWQEGTPDWLPAERTEFVHDQDSPLNNPYAPSTPYDAFELHGVRPVPATPAWIMALVPLALIPLSYVPYTGFVGVALYIALSLWDRRLIKAAGRETSLAFLWPVLLSGFGAPVYLFLRASRIDRQWAYAVVGLLTAVVFFADTLGRLAL
jgi:hypothetical protein